MSDASWPRGENTTLFVRLSPAHKQRIIKAFADQEIRGGFMGTASKRCPGVAVLRT